MKVLIINGHPREESFSSALVLEYRIGAQESSAEVDVLNLFLLNFELSLKFGYEKMMELEPDLLEPQEKLMSADHLVWVFPVW